VPDYCTCGAELPPDARFCHKCGKPQREEPEFQQIVESQAVPPLAPLAPPPPPSIEIGFHNSLVVRLGFLSALLANLLILTPYLYIASPVWLAVAGFLCVRWYMRRSGQPLTVRSGARIGWVTGVFSFIISSVLWTLAFITAVQSGMLEKIWRDQVSGVPGFQVNPNEVSEMLRNPVMLGFSLLMFLFVWFVLSTACSVAGGALGAKVRNSGLAK
jgi:hypothetical protein